MKNLTIKRINQIITFLKSLDIKSKRFIEIINKSKWDEGNEYFPPTSFQISSIYSDKVASNMIPSWVKIEFNLRFSNELTQKDIEKKFEELLTNNEIQYEIDWNCSAEPFVTEQGRLTGVFQKVIKNIEFFCSSNSSSISH